MTGPVPPSSQAPLSSQAASPSQAASLSQATLPSTLGQRREFVLTLSCPDRPGIVYAVASFLVQHGCNIERSEQYDDDSNATGEVDGTFFMRVQFSTLDPVQTIERLRTGFTAVAESFRMRWRLVDATTRARVLILVSRFGHCLNDLLFRHRIGALNIDIPAVVSNHPDFRDLVESQQIPFIHLPVEPGGKPATEKRLMEIVETEQIDLVVLARYMQILSPDLCEQLSGRAINIHHSFLPSFKGARPYQQAHQRGVKIIGATAHYVTSDLDEGPIIEQDVERVDHSTTPEQMAAVGRDVECKVLGRAVAWHTQNKVMIHGPRTIVFR